jgi:hypothetical protein
MLTNGHRDFPETSTSLGRSPKRHTSCKPSFAAGRAMATMDLLQFLKGWLGHHVQAMHSV